MSLNELHIMCNFFELFLTLEISRKRQALLFILCNYKQRQRSNRRVSLTSKIQKQSQNSFQLLLHSGFSSNPLRAVAITGEDSAS